jgi:hypothetical protein
MSDKPKRRPVEILVVPRACMPRGDEWPIAFSMLKKRKGVSVVMYEDPCPISRPRLVSDNPMDPVSYVPGFEAWGDVALFYEGPSSWPKDTPLLGRQTWD